MPVLRKPGRWHNSEIAYMRENAGKVPLAEMAAKLDKNAFSVAKWIKENLAIDVSGDTPLTLPETEVRNELRASPDWLELKSQFIESELRFFEYKYSKMVAQFQGDIYATEETQIFLLIKLEILMNRNLKNRARALEDIERLEKDLQDLYEQHKPGKGKKLDDSVRDRLTNLENQLASAREAETSKTKEYTDLSGKHSALMKEMKATRDQRISKIENSKGSYIELIKELQRDDIRQREGEDIEIMRLAVEHERKRLTNPHRYVDDSIDTPLLIPEGATENE